MKAIATVGVVGAGTMGGGLAQKFAQEGFTVILLDRTIDLVERGLDAISHMLQEGVSRKVFRPDDVAATLGRIHVTADIADMASCDLVVEAIFENLQAKTDLFHALGDIVSPDCILATNTSSFSVTELSAAVRRPERFCGLHYFFHAAKNRLVEIIAGARTSRETMESVERFCFLTGKDPIHCADRYGFAVNRFFVPWLNEAVRLLEEGIATIPEIDAICMKAFGIGMGPFALMNATGVAIAWHAQQTLESFGTLYTVAEALREQGESGRHWATGDPATITIDERTERIVRDRMMGLVFLVCCQILDEGVCTPTELNRGARIGLKWHRGPIDLMQSMGRSEVERLIRTTATHYQTPFPRDLGAPFLPMEYVRLSFVARTAIITVSRPEDLDALNEDVVEQIGKRFAEAESNESCETIVFTGSGKAFVAGADISLFIRHIRNGTIHDIVDFTARTQDVFDRIDRSTKKVIALLNGMTLGGGLELALCADEIYALPQAVLAFPETGIGIYPGLGGTQRTQRRVGRGLTKYLIYTGDMINATAARGMGLIDDVITSDEYFTILGGGHVERLSGERSEPRDVRWDAIGSFFASHSLDDLFDHNGAGADLSPDDIERWRKRVGQKAPMALRVAERLVDEEKGCASELEYLPVIFSSNDALLGLSSVGQKVAFHGN